MMPDYYRKDELPDAEDALLKVETLGASSISRSGLSPDPQGEKLAVLYGGPNWRMVIPTAHHVAPHIVRVTMAVFGESATFDPERGQGMPLLRQVVPREFYFFAWLEGEWNEIHASPHDFRSLLRLGNYLHHKRIEDPAYPVDWWRPQIGTTYSMKDKAGALTYAYSRVFPDEFKAQLPTGTKGRNQWWFRSPIPGMPLPFLSSYAERAAWEDGGKLTHHLKQWMKNPDILTGRIAFKCCT